MKKILLVQLLILSLAMALAQSQSVISDQDGIFIPLWPEGKMPNSKGILMKDSIVNERIYRVGTPGMRAFLPSKQENRGAAVLICPGGGYSRLAYVISGTQLAKWFNTMGISAFVLNYRLPHSMDLQQRDTGPLQDAQRAIKIIRSNAGAWGIKSNRIGIQGSSAGGHLAAMASVSESDISAIADSLDAVSPRPDFSILVSPVIDLGKYAHAGSRNNLLGEETPDELIRRYSPHLHVSPKTPPSFIVHAFNDNVVSAKNSLLFYNALLESKVPSTLHVFPQGGHAIALRNNPGSANQWTSLCEAWLIEMSFISEKL